MPASTTVTQTPSRRMARLTREIGRHAHTHTHSLTHSLTYRHTHTHTHTQSRAQASWHRQHHPVSAARFITANRHGSASPRNPPCNQTAGRRPLQIWPGRPSRSAAISLCSPPPPAYPPQQPPLLPIIPIAARYLIATQHRGRHGDQARHVRPLPPRPYSKHINHGDRDRGRSAQLLAAQTFPGPWLVLLDTAAAAAMRHLCQANTPGIRRTARAGNPSKQRIARHDGPP